jgi:hypothetical protein
MNGARAHEGRCLDGAELSNRKGMGRVSEKRAAAAHHLAARSNRFRGPGRLS